MAASIVHWLIRAQTLDFLIAITFLAYMYIQCIKMPTLAFPPCKMTLLSMINILIIFPPMDLNSHTDIMSRRKQYIP